MSEFFIAPYYLVEVIGTNIEVYSFSQAKKGKPLKQNLHHHGYLRVNINGDEVFIHRLVAEIYLGACPDGLVVNHIDGNKLNNSSENLEYITQIDNAKHAAKIGLLPKGKDCRLYKHGLSRTVEYKRQDNIRNRDLYNLRRRTTYAARRKATNDNT